jgi:hypothetical protein
MDEEWAFLFMPTYARVHGGYLMMQSRRLVGRGTGEREVHNYSLHAVRGVGT